MAFGLTLIILSLLAVPSLLLSRRPDAKQYLDKLVPFQGWFGVICCFLGIWGIIDCVLSLNILGFGMWGVIYWTLWLLCSVVLAGLGFTLGYGLIAKHALKGEKARAKGEQILTKIQPLAGKLGVLGIILGLLDIVAWILL
ncbi:MAG: hypothetical protein LBU80_01920 [Rikenellaceae bacterium]|jgi:hypothetical protein|nr:hypothetical protein [Rikenellaceae bacterium]